ncbi:MAG: DEAD/DEAH box helicase [Ignavibacteria bacterium]|nr:DEAD/DEAH box helicase [Ignavibacteria bacterium]MCU7501884.1 DEAD/DEAH box helicase [Ignavibacteria bacterium]MCU7514770.1 DEAD/DEAH box helicase [Ignavibacteria bacterium]
MARNEFGRTWWGNAWIEALEKGGVDKEKLEEAKASAAKGNVKEIKIKNREIRAFVLDQQETYEPKISLIEFSEEEKKEVLNIIKGNPALASGLSLGRLPEGILDLMKDEGIPLFPTSWQRVTSSCTCQDSENPCLHRMAAYFLIANEVDKNPFILFNLRGISTEWMMGKLGLVAIEEINREDEEFTPYEKLKAGAPLPEETEPDLSFDDLNIRSLFTLLPDSPLFYNEGNFKLMLIEKYKSLASYAETISIEDEINPALKRLEIYMTFQGKKPGTGNDPEEEPSFLFSPETYIQGIKTQDDQLTVNIPVLSPSGPELQKRKMKVAGRTEVMNYFLSLPLELSKESSSRSVRFLNLASSIALALVRTFSFVPELKLFEDNSFSIHFIPLIHDEKTRAAMDLLKHLAPENFMFGKNGREVYKEPGNFILQEFITYIVHQQEARLGRNFYFSDRKIYNAFFKGERFKPERFEEESYAKAVLDWLERLAFRKRALQPAVVVKSLSADKYSLQVEIWDRRNENSKPLPFQMLFEQEDRLRGIESEVIRTETLREIKIAGEYFPQLNTILNSRGSECGVLTSEEIFDFITRTSDILKLLGLKVILPENIKDLAEPKLILTARDRSHHDSLTYFSLKDVLEFQWEVAIGSSVISAEEFRKMAESSRGIVKLKESYFLLDPEKAQTMLGEINRKPGDFAPRDILQTFLTGEFQGKKFIPDEGVTKKLGELLKAGEEVGYPESLRTRLRPYQQAGFRWLYTNLTKGFGCCLADDMGLGKTVQVIALILRFKEEGKLDKPALVICPTTVVGNWYKELTRFAPTLKVFIYHGSQRRLTLKNADVVVTSYGTLRSDEEKFGKYSWTFGIIDEAQNIKNPDAAQTRAVKSISAKNRVAVSGTPVQNRMTELWSIFDYINNGYLGSLGSFKKNFSVPIEKYRDKDMISRLKKITSPFILRRLKTDETIIKDLPDKIVFDEYCYLTKDQTVLYESVVKSALSELKLNKGASRTGAIFKLITELKQICNHPSQFTKEEDYRKDLSGKSEKTVELLEKMLRQEEKILIFTQYKEMGDILKSMIRSDLKQEAFFFHGSLTRSQRDKMVAGFQEKPDNKIMIVSLKAGGTGLNLTAAARVIHYDLWWNPAVEAQATDRAYRIGQHKNVTVHRLITLGTFEEKIDDMIKQKKELSELTVAVGESWITELPERELKKIFSLQGRSFEAGGF